MYRCYHIILGEPANLQERIHAIHSLMLRQGMLGSSADCQEAGICIRQCARAVHGRAQQEDLLVQNSMLACARMGPHICNAVHMRDNTGKSFMPTILCQAHKRRCAVGGEGCSAHKYCQCMQLRALQSIAEGF